MTSSTRTTARRAAAALATVAATAALTVAPTSSAQAIENCKWSTVAPLMLSGGWTMSGPCYANAGTVITAIPDMKRLQSGNNAGYVSFKRNGVTVRKNFAKYQSVWLNNPSGAGHPGVTVIRITIY